MLYVRFASNYTNIKKNKNREFQYPSHPNLFNLKKASHCRFKFPNSVKCLNEAD